MKLRNKNACKARPVNDAPRLTGRAAREQMTYTTVKILDVLDKGEVWPNGATEHEMRERFEDLGKAIDALRTKGQIMVKAKSENRGQGKRSVYVITPAGRARLERLRAASAAEPVDPPRPLWQERTEEGRRTGPAAPKVLAKLEDWGKGRGRAPLAGPKAEEGPGDWSEHGLQGGVRRRGDGFDELRRLHGFSFACGVDEGGVPLAQSDWKGREEALAERLEWQLTSHRAGTSEAIRWATASRILGVRVEDLRAVQAKITRRPKVA